MVMIQNSGAVNKLCTISDTRARLKLIIPSKVTNVSVNSSLVANGCCSNGNQSSSFSWKGFARDKIHQPSHQITSKRLLCQQQDSVSSDDDEYRSSRNIAITLFKRYRNFIDKGGGDNLKEFISAGVNAYALGYTDEGLRKELTNMKESSIEIEEMQTYGGGTSLKSKICYEEVNECILWLSIIFITILCTPQPTVVRWSPTPPVSDEIKLQWKGFCGIIANAYYLRGMAWLPVKTLQLEQMAVVGCSEEPSVVASRMRLVFSTLESIVVSKIAHQLIGCKFKPKKGQMLLVHNGHKCSGSIMGKKAFIFVSLWIFRRKKDVYITDMGHQPRYSQDTTGAPSPPL
ncbi:hypothetical protein SSX86_028435 [Deinandra increscens subsp. villosa]|uniref:DUF7876 domain-containing protein n=1 Tax=Deinandra increscens subsp. villosa TaxID=3103831 RepID=A0AAP0GKH5_9ASTR